MSDSQIKVLPGRGNRLARSGAFVSALGRQLWHDRLLFLIAGLALLTAHALKPVVGIRPDMELVQGFLGQTALYCVLMLAIWMAVELFRHARRDPTGSPLRSLGATLSRFSSRDGRIHVFASTLAVFTIFASGFSILKSAIAVLKPFAFDRLFSEADRWLHFGYLPHDVLMPAFGSPYAILAMNVAYNVWFAVLVSYFLICGVLTGRFALLRRQYMIAFMVVWFVGGFLIATGLSSAGPAFYALVGEGDDYAGLMAHLKAASEVVPVWAINVQDTLWDGYSGERYGSAGISAMPSMHVATAVLFALAASSISKRFAIVMWVYAAIIQIGSVVLAWHYAVDGYAGALISVAAWKLAGKMARQETPAR